MLLPILYSREITRAQTILTLYNPDLRLFPCMYVCSSHNERAVGCFQRQISGGLQDRGTTLSLPALGNCSSQDPEMKERDDQAVPPSRKSQRYVSR